MAKLALFLLGPPRLECDGEPLQFDTRKIMALVAYLAVTDQRAGGRRISRDSLLALLWPELEASRARAVLRRNLSLLRSALHGEWLATDRQTVGTDPEADFWLDVTAFTRLLGTWENHGHTLDEVCPDCLADLERAAALYQGDFLEGFGLRDSVEFDDWLLYEAEELRRALATALERLVIGYSNLENPAAALPHARRRLSLDPLHEPAHRQLMELYAQTGERSAALRQFQECVRILDEELGLAPSDETIDLYEHIRSTRRTSQDPLGSTATAVPVGAPRRAVRARHNLPAQTTPFVGRQQELAEISSRLLDRACRLLTLLGPGGIGKTRLALEVAEHLAGTRPVRFEHGLYFVALAPLQTAEGMVPAVAEALGYSFRTDVNADTRATPRQQLLDYLGGKQMLLVMDNYEHRLADETAAGGEDSGAGFLTDVLASAPGVKVLATSRERIGVQGEHLYPVAGLPVPDASLPPLASTGQALSSYAAVDLFVQAARRARATFDPDAGDLTHVVKICRLVQGMPLAILLAAAWVEILATEEIAAEIQQSLDFLETGVRSLPARQRSIRAVFDHSWRLLSERERELFEKLSVFRGGFTREAAMEIAGASLRDLLSLVNQSLVQSPSAGRYELHELLRQYGAGQLDQDPERRLAILDRHSAFYGAALERWAGELKGAHQRETLNEMDLEIENGRAAWHWAAEQGRIAHLSQGVEGMWLYHALRLRQEEGETAFAAAVRGIEPFDSSSARLLLAKCLTLWSSFLLDLAQGQASIRAAARGMALLGELEGAGVDVQHEMALALFHEARIKRYFRPDPLEAKAAYARSAALYAEVGDRWGQARALAYLGWMVEQLGLFGEAQELCEQSLAIRRELGDQHGMADAMLNLGIICWVQGELDEAHRLLRESLGIFGAIDDWYRIAQTLKSLGEVLVRKGLFEDGLGLIESSATIYDDLGYAFGRWGLLPFLGEAKLHLGLYSAARADAEQGTGRAEHARHRWGVGFSQFVTGLVALADGTHREARSLFQDSIEAFEQVRQRENRGWVLGPLALAARGEGDLELARACAVEALEIGIELGAFMPVLYGLPAAALLMADRGGPDLAVEVYACASQFPFIAQSHWFRDVLGRPMEAVVAELPADSVAVARERGQTHGWREMATKLLADL